jgi:hypothetical protein
VEKPIANLMAVGLLVVAACGTGGEVESGPITSFEDIAGTYQLLRPGGQVEMYIQFFEDGTIHYSSNRDLVEERPFAIVETRFEGTEVFLKAVESVCGFEGDATYEIHLLESGNLQFVLIEHKSHTCAQRSDILQGAELWPVP